METVRDFDALWDFNDPSATETRFRKVLEEDRTEDPTYRIELLTQIVRALTLQRRFDEARQILETISADLDSVEDRGRVRFLLEQGRLFNSSGAKDQAKAPFMEAWEIAQGAGEDGLAVDAAHMVAIVEDSERSLKWNLLALDLSVSSEAPSAQKWRKSLHNNLGWTFFDRDELETALSHFEKALQCAQESSQEESIRIARWTIARTYREMGRVGEALEMQMMLPETGFVFEERGECLYVLGRVEEAKPNFAAAFDRLSQDPWFVENYPDRLKRLKTLSL